MLAHNIIAYMLNEHDYGLQRATGFLRVRTKLNTAVYIKFGHLLRLHAAPLKITYAPMACLTCKHSTVEEGQLHLTCPRCSDARSQIPQDMQADILQQDIRRVLRSHYRLYEIDLMIAQVIHKQTYNYIVPSISKLGLTRLRQDLQSLK